MGIFTKSIGIDMGTAFIRICKDKESEIFSAPAVAAIDCDTGRVASVGAEAEEMLSATPERFTAVKPIKNGVVSDYDITCEILKRCINQAIGKSRLKPDATVAIPGNITDVEIRALRSALLASGIKNIRVIDSSIAAAMGVGMSMKSPQGRLVIDIGAGTAEIAVICMGEIVASQSLRVAGDNFDADIKKYVKNHYGINIGEKIAEDIKNKIGSVSDTVNSNQYTVRGRETTSGLPGSTVINSAEVGSALSRSIRSILEALSFVFEQTPYELVSDICDNGIILTGGSSRLEGFAELISSETGIKTIIPDNYESAVVRGCAVAFSTFD